MKRVPDTNTPDQHRVLLLYAMVGGKNGIEMQEAQGQQALANSSQLPFEGSEQPEFKEMGIKFSKREGNDIFIDAELPAGWKIVPTEHSMWSDLLDNKGRKRAAIFYKAAFYDRHAHMNSVTRFSIRRDYGEKAFGEPDKEITHYVLDGDKRLFSKSVPVKPHSVPVVVGSEDIKRYYREVDAATKLGWAACEEYLKQNGFPEYKNAAKYWDN